jgi:hypothetical protein
VHTLRCWHHIALFPHEVRAARVKAEESRLLAAYDYAFNIQEQHKAAERDAILFTGRSPTDYPQLTARQQPDRRCKPKPATDPTPLAQDRGRRESEWDRFRRSVKDRGLSTADQQALYDRYQEEAAVTRGTGEAGEGPLAGTDPLGGAGELRLLDLGEFFALALGGPDPGRPLDPSSAFALESLRADADAASSRDSDTPLDRLFRRLHSTSTPAEGGTRAARPDPPRERPKDAEHLRRGAPPAARWSMTPASGGT